MAKAYFKCAECGDSVMVVGSNRSQADRLAKYRESQKALCHTCWTKLRDAERAEASQQAAECAVITGLPVLQGTEKQIAWAETIRAEALKQLEVGIAGKGDIYYWDDSHIFVLLTEAEQDEIRVKSKIMDEEARTVFRSQVRAGLFSNDRMALAIKAIKANDSAHWWIENREYKASKLLADQYRATAPSVQPTPPAEIVADAKAEATVRPESPLTETIAEIAIDGAILKVKFPEKREDFRQLIRFQLGFTWADTHWRKPLTATAGKPADRAAEVGHALLGVGFIVRIYDPAIRASAVAGNYEPEHTRWIKHTTSGPYAGQFFILWGKDEDFYVVAKRLPRSRYNKPGIQVPAEFFDEVLDFAEQHGFRMSDAAQTLADQARANKEAVMVAKVAPKPKRAKVVAENKPVKLESQEEGIADDLLDS